MAAQDGPRRNWLAGLLGLVGFSAIAGVLVTITVAPAVALTGVAASSAIGVFDSIPDYFDLEELPQRNEIWAHQDNGYVQVATIFDQNREQVPYTQISPYVVDGLVAAEDRRFFDHGGVDIPGVIRAAIGNLGSGDIESGASTLTMQLVKQTFIQQAYELPTEEERTAAYNEATATTFDRKLKEMKIAISLEKRYTKKEILTAYLNIAYFGSQTYGIEAAAQRYFGIHASELSLPQAAALVAIVQYPELRNLANPDNFQANQERRDYVLDQMLAEGYIDQQQHDEAKAIPVDAAFVANGKIPQQGCRTADIYARWFCDYVVKSVKDFDFLGASAEERQANWAKGGYKLYVTLDMNSQHVAQDSVWYWAPNDYSVAGYDEGSTAVTVEPGTGKVRVMAENKIFDDAFEPENPATDSSVNYNTTYDYGGSTGFQPGSTYKLFTLTQWLIAGHGIYEVINGSEGTIPANQWHDRCTGAGVDTKVVNDSHESGSYTVQAGTWGSVNGVFLRMATKLDLCDINELAAKMGVKTGDGHPLENNPTSVIGTNTISPLSLAQAYATIAAGGKTCDPIIIESWTDPDGNSHPGQTPSCRQVVDPDIAATVASVLVGNTANGTGWLSDPGDGIPMMTKTGTTDGAEQTWVAASTTTNTTIVWVGNASGHQSQYSVYTNGYANNVVRHEIMRSIMTAENARFSGGQFPTPSGKYDTGGKTTVPNVSNLGLTLEQASQILRAVGFEVEYGGQVDSDQPKGTVAMQDPAGDGTAGAGATVKIWESKQNMTVIPNVVGNPVSAAAATLAAANYPTVTVAVSCPAGKQRASGVPASMQPTDPRVSGRTVDAQSPAGGTLQVTGAALTLSATLDGGDPTQCVPVPGPTPSS